MTMQVTALLMLMGTVHGVNGLIDKSSLDPVQIFLIGLVVMDLEYFQLLPDLRHLPTATAWCPLVLAPTHPDHERTLVSNPHLALMFLGARKKQVPGLVSTLAQQAAFYKDPAVLSVGWHKTQGVLYTPSNIGQIRGDLEGSLIVYSQLFSRIILASRT